MTGGCDIVVTWPKTRRFGSYVASIHQAARDGLLINYRVRNRPDQARLAPDARCYRVHDGMVRGYTPISTVAFHASGEVARVKDDPISGNWPAGWYVVCRPVFVDIKPIRMEGFRGWRYFDRTQVEQ